MKRLLLFFGNFLVAMWLGFIVTLISSSWFIIDHLEYKQKIKQPKKD
jgi:hypothetical protein